MTDFWLSKLFFDMQDAGVRDQFRADPDALMTRYRLPAQTMAAVKSSDLDYLAPRVNPYLLRYYCGYIAMPEDEFLRRIKTTGAPDAFGPAYG
jgi:hypothetical protein